MTDRHFAFLRGINVGGKNRIKMDALRGAFEAAGATDVETYIQSGNVVFSPGKKTLAKVVAAVATTLADSGLNVPLICLSAGAFVAIADANPFAKEAAADPKSVHVFLPAAPLAAAVQSTFDLDRGPPDALSVHDRALYLHTPNGIARTKFTSAYLDKTAKTVLTARNWKTVAAMCALAQ